jgi:predicted RNA-binding protein with PUA-like domain
LAKPIGLAQLKADPAINHIDLIRLGRLSVISLKKADFDYILKLSQQ